MLKIAKISQRTSAWRRKFDDNNEMTSQNRHKSNHILAAWLAKLSFCALWRSTHYGRGLILRCQNFPRTKLNRISLLMSARWTRRACVSVGVREATHNQHTRSAMWRRIVCIHILMCWLWWSVVVVGIVVILVVVGFRLFFLFCFIRRNNEQNSILFTLNAITSSTRCRRVVIIIDAKQHTT